ncbi:outer membrane protein Iml2/Tetratricopeptide repeat protein 39, partial [Cladochytrium replicatum]
MERKLDADLADVEKAVRLFLNSQFSDAEAHLKTRYAVSLYHAHGFGLISMMRAVLTFEPQDIESARDSLKRTVDMCKVLRKEQTLVAGIFQSITGGNGVGNMNRLQKHAELIHAESLLFRAMLSLVGDNANLIGLVQQGLTIRAAYSIYKTMYQHFDKVYQEHGVPGLTKEGIDRHLISGVVCGMGCFSLMLSLLPSKILRIFELVGFSGDRDSGLRFLEHGGGWDRLGGGIRKFMCDLMLSIHHVVISTLLQLHDMDIGFADEILRRQLDQSPNSVIFLGLSARLKQTKLEPQKALAEYERVIAECHEWRHLSHGTLWDMGICYGSTLNWPKVYECFETLERESRWSKAVYLYMMAAALDAQGDQPQRVIDLMNEVPGATKKVAGKSVPIEKLIARKARKFRDQGCRLMLPALEILYFFNVFE